jgi:hypothetical protein
VTIDVEICFVAVQPLAHVICKPPHCQNVSGLKQSEGITFAKPLAGKDFLGYGFKARIVGLKWVHVRHLFDDTAG